jgi:hypothetical protein
VIHRGCGRALCSDSPDQDAPDRCPRNMAPHTPSGCRVLRQALRDLHGHPRCLAEHDRRRGMRHGPECLLQPLLPDLVGYVAPRIGQEDNVRQVRPDPANRSAAPAVARGSYASRGVSACDDLGRDVVPSTADSVGESNDGRLWVGEGEEHEVDPIPQTAPHPEPRAKLRAASMDSKTKSRRAAASSSSRWCITRPAAMAAASWWKADSPTAIVAHDCLRTANVMRARSSRTRSSTFRLSTP